ncbi:Flp family type IVb pilin [Devosia sp. LjRoot3]|uniref:Flp family type IVb pilin n=1 Tax=Devosia sp. LjRoot3 TaxID=3342319 RepID=UPI003ECFB0FC
MMKIALTKLKRFAADEGGATAIEYALIGSLLSIVIIGAIGALNGSMTEIYEEIRSYIVPALEGTPMPDEG